ncbi:MAG: hypothetical protein ACOX8S_10125 [Christensenellales bacterium]
MMRKKHQEKAVFSRTDLPARKYAIQSSAKFSMLIKLIKKPSQRVPDAQGALFDIKRLE